MPSKSSAVALLIVACVGAAAGGAYVAVRQSSPGAVSASVAPAPAGAPVEADALAAPLPVLQPSGVQPAGHAAPPRPSARPASSAPARREPAPPRPVERRTGPASTPAPRPVPPPAPALRVDEPLPALDSEAVPPPRFEPPLAPARFFEDLVVPASSVLGLQIDTPVSSERARVEDRVEARVQRDVTVDGRTAVPSGTRALGVVTVVDRGGKMKDRARLGVRFHTLVLADGTHLPVQTETIYREGDSPGAESARKIGGAAAGGAILGAIIGGKKGALIGGATGAAGGTAVVAAGERNAATLPAGAVVTVRISEPLVVEVERR